MRQKKVLVAESDDSLRALLCEILENAGFEPLSASTPEITLEILRSHRRIDCAFVELGIEELRDRRYVGDLGEAVRRCAFPLVIISFSKEVESIAVHCRACAWLVKPFDLEQFLRTARKLADANIALSGS